MTGVQVMVVLIVAIAIFGSIVRARYAHSAKRADPAAERENERLRQELAQLKDRLAVLERITIEKENSLERQIEELRDR